MFLLQKPGRFGQPSPFKGHGAQQSNKNVQGTFFSWELKGYPSQMPTLNIPFMSIGSGMYP